MNIYRENHKELKYSIKSIEQFLKETGREWDWDDFTSRPLRDADLDAVRMIAGSLELPLSEEGRLVLEDLLGCLQGRLV